MSRKTFRACVLTATLLLPQATAFTQTSANAKDSAQDKSGEVRNIEFLKFTPEDFPEKEKDDLIKKSFEAAGRIKFRPPRKDGRLVSQRIKLEYCFDPEEKKKE